MTTTPRRKGSKRPPTKKTILPGRDRFTAEPRPTAETWIRSHRHAVPLADGADRIGVIGGRVEDWTPALGDDLDEVAHLGVFDAIGHGLNAALMVSVAMGAFRHARRTSLDLESTWDGIDDAISTQFGPDRFVTGVLATLDLDTGVLAYLLAGHHPGVVVRAGRVVRHLDAFGRLPFGLGKGSGPIPRSHIDQGWTAGGAGRVGTEALEPGDRVLFYTDGVIEPAVPTAPSSVWTASKSCSSMRTPARPAPPKPYAA